jgi:hypothetical protein
MFFKGSRYENVDANQITDPTGRVLVYKKVRFIPPTPGLMNYTVVQGDRLDLIANRAFRDAQRFWRICDATDGMWPDDLATIGKMLQIPSSEG